jgi:hypothetical protein
MRGPDRQPVAVQNIDRRSFLFTAAGIVIGTRRARAQSAVTRPVVSEKACPLETIAPVAADGHSGLAVLRKPPGAGPFPVVVWFHGGIATVPLTRLEATAISPPALASWQPARSSSRQRIGVVTSIFRPPTPLKTVSLLSSTFASFRASTDRASSWADVVEVGTWRFTSPRAPAYARWSARNRQSS